MLGKKGHVGEERACWGRKGMLGKKGHVGEERACWGRKGMLGKKGNVGEERTKAGFSREDVVVVDKWIVDINQINVNLVTGIC